MEDNVNGVNSALEDSAVVREIEKKQAKQNTILFWICLAGLLIGIAGTIILWNKVNNQNLEGIEPVQVRVVDVTKRNLRVNGKTKISYDVTVEYDGEEYELKDGGYSPWTVKGHKGTAYMYDGKIYPNEDAVATGTALGTLYYVFLFASFALLFITPSVGSKASKLRKRALKKA